MTDRSQLQCRADGCFGTLGAWAEGQFIPAGHLIGGRDWIVGADGITRVRCTRCHAWSELVVRDGRLVLVPLADVSRR